MQAEEILERLQKLCAGEMSQSEIARRVGISQATINDYLNKRSDISNVTFRVLQKLAPLLHIRICDAREAQATPPALANLMANWSRLPASSQNALGTMIDNTLAAHGLGEPESGDCSAKKIG